VIADKLITAYQVRSRRHGRVKANETVTLLSVRWSACSVTASGGGAESCPTGKAIECLCLSLPLNVLTGAERSAAEGRAFNGVYENSP
jgi:hypothetical protein